MLATRCWDWGWKRKKTLSVFDRRSICLSETRSIAWKLCQPKEHYWYNESNVRNVCTICGLIDKYPTKSSRLLRFDKDYSSGVNKKIYNTRVYTDEKFRHINQTWNNIDELYEYYESFLLFLGQRKLTIKYFQYFNKFLDILLSYKKINNF